LTSISCICANFDRLKTHGTAVDLTKYLSYLYQGRNQDFAKGKGGLRMEKFCDVFSMTILGDII